jgi:hypothetical protein
VERKRIWTVSHGNKEIWSKRRSSFVADIPVADIPVAEEAHE